jgi:predicted ester cyclase
MSAHQSSPPSVERDRALVRRVVEEVWNHGNVEMLDQLFASSPGRSAETSRHQQGAEQMKQSVGLYRALAPDLHVTVDQLIAEGDAVMVRWTARGTHTGTVQGLAPADVLGQEHDGFHLRLLSTIRPDGRQLSFDGVAVFQLTNGQVAAVWLLLDEVGVLRQLGALPLPGPPN